MAAFLGEDFLLDSEMAKRLYHGYASKEPIFDYHCHLSPQDIALDRRFENLTEIWLKGDHYKWRAMRWNGVDERFCTGDASDYEKFQAWAATVPNTLGNPLYHWTHLELRRPFGITDQLLSPTTADAIWERGNSLLSKPEFSARGILQQMNVRMVGTTDDPADDLGHHAQIASDTSFSVKVLPSFRPDRAFKPAAVDYPSYLEKLGKAAGIEISDINSLYSALEQRMDHFTAHGCKIADHGLERVQFALATDAELNGILKRRLDGTLPDEHEQAQFMTAVLVFLGREYHRRGWVQQYHMGPLRNNSTRGWREIGADAGFDSMDDRPIAAPLNQLLDALDRNDQLPKTILYCVNPLFNEVLATTAGNFQGSGIPGKVQFGSGWWFNDQLDGMERQMTQLSQLGLLSHFVGMLTDSRSFLSFTRHEYFRRLLCRMLGRWVEDGQLPSDERWLGELVSNISFYNARRYFDVDV
ncbi:glucuronate isomerase [Halomonas sp. AOP27-A1-41]|uniref:glucuronate isomerase n=1 Tax=Halomonas sp. AOP27-A1-41 TaxID=3457707 RepID=UPI0040339B70